MARAFAKHGSLLCPEYLRFARALGCYVCGSAFAQAHHWPYRSSGVTRDDFTYGLCALDHKRAHGEVVVINGVRRAPLADIEQDIAVARTRVRFMEEVDAVSLAKYCRALMRWRENRGEAVAF